MKFYCEKKEDVLKEVKSSSLGLSSAEAEKRLKIYGDNVLEEKKKASPFLMFLAQFKDFMTILLIVAAAISAVIAFITKDKNEIVDTFILLFIILLNNLVGFIQQYRADNAIRKMKQLSKSYTKVLRDGKIISIEGDKLTVGDIAVFEEGDKVTADCRILSEKNCKCNESSLTGESEQVEKRDCRLSEDVPLAERVNMLYSSTFVTHGHTEAVVVGTGMQTEIGKIAKLIDQAEVLSTPLQNALDKLGKVISYVVVAIAAFIFVFGIFFRPAGLLSNFMSSVAIAVAAIPEGLPAVVTILMALGVQRMSAQKAIIRKLQAVETLGSCDTLCSDKTGTLTQNKMYVQEAELFGNEEVACVCMKVCNSVKSMDSGDATELALINYVDSLSRRISEWRKIDEIPFDSERKMMSVLATCNGQRRVYSKGGVDILLKKCTHFSDRGKIRRLNENDRKRISDLSSDMAGRALRVLGFAFKDFSGVFDEENLVFCGFCGMMDPPKESAYGAIEKCGKAGITLIMITGDQKNTALAIAKRLKIASSAREVMTGEELDSLRGQALEDRICASRVFARVSPKHKELIVRVLQKHGKTVAMTGDGVNDAPALKRADIGVAMGSGTDVAKNVSDMVVADDDLSTIVSAVKEGRRIFSNIGKTVAFYLATNLGEVLSILFVTLMMPQYFFLNSTQLLWINLITDSFPVLALGAEKAEKDSMSRPPIRAEKKMFSFSFFFPVVVFGILQSMVTIGVFVFFLQRGGNEVASGAAMLSMSFTELFHSFNVRTEKKSVLGKNLFENKILLLTVFCAALISILLFVVPPLRNIFSLAALSVKQFLLIAVTSLFILPAGELYKFVIRNRKDDKKDKESKHVKFLKKSPKNT